MTTTTKVLIGVGVAAVVAYLLKPKIVAQAMEYTADFLRSKTWTENRTMEVYTGSRLNPQPIGNGQYQIGDGYVGTFINSNTLVTTTRHGQPDPRLEWSFV